MDHLLLPPSTSLLKLEAHQTLLAAARAGTWLQVKRGVVVVQPPPRWLGDCMAAPARRLAPGAGIAVDEDGWWRFVAEAGPAELDCICAVEAPSTPWLERILAALRVVTRRLRPS